MRADGDRGIDDIKFNEGVYVDFNGDGIKESVLSFMIYPEGWVFCPCLTVYVDGSGKAGFIYPWEHYANSAELRVINFGEFAALDLVAYFGAAGMDNMVYTFFDGEPKLELQTGKGSLTCENGVLKAVNMYSGLGGDQNQNIYFDRTKKAFVQMGREEITREDFIKHVKGGEEMLTYFRSLKEKTEPRIYTEGYCNYYFTYPEKSIDSSDVTEYYCMSFSANGRVMTTVPSECQTRNGDFLEMQDIYVKNEDNIVYDVDYYGLTPTNLQRK